jgi:hypothetical protein
MNLFQYRPGRWWYSALAGWALVATLILTPITLLLWGMPSSAYERVGWSPWWPRLVSAAVLAFWWFIAARMFYPGWWLNRARGRIFRNVRQKYHLLTLPPSTRPKPALDRFLSGDAVFDLRLMAGEMDGVALRVADSTVILQVPVGWVSKGVDWIGQGDAEEYMEIRLTYAFAPSTLTAFPRLMVRGENTIDRLKALVGLEDIDFESHEFSTKFNVQSENRRFAHDILTPQVMELLMQHPNHSVFFDTQGVVVLNGPTLWSEEEFEPAMRLCTGIVKAIPPYVWERYAI